MSAHCAQENGFTTINMEVKKGVSFPTSIFFKEKGQVGTANSTLLFFTPQLMYCMVKTFLAQMFNYSVWKCIIVLYGACNNCEPMIKT